MLRAQRSPDIGSPYVGGSPSTAFVAGDVEGGAAYDDDVDFSKPKTGGGGSVKAPPGTTAAAIGVGLLFLVITALSSPGSAARYGAFVTACVAYGTWFSRHLQKWIEARPGGDDGMRQISEPIATGAAGFLSVQYRAIFRLAAPLALAIGASYQLRPEPRGDPGGAAALSRTVLGIVASGCFLVGAGCSALSGYAAMCVASHANVRVADAAKRSAADALVVCFRGGAFSAVLNLTLCVAGVGGLFAVISATGIVEDIADVPILLVGYGFGASFVALFMQLGGGIYTKAADVGADLVGKVEQAIPEDDPRNPAVVADLVGDMVGDCVGSSADVFESVGAEIIGAMILGGRLARDAGSNPAPVVFFPLVVHAIDLLASSLGILYVSRDRVVALERSEGEYAPMAVLQRGYTVTLGVAFAGFALACRWLLDVEGAPDAWKHFLGCGCCGFLTAFVCMRSSRYYTDYAFEPVRRIAEAATTGHGTTIIVGLAVGLESVVVPVLTVGVAVVTSYHLGRTAGVGGGAEAASKAAGLFGTAVATMGMLASAVYILSMNNFGPIADNAGGIAEMSRQPARVRDATDALDAAGNVTKAVTKGYSIGSAALACFLLFGAFMDEFSLFSGTNFESVDVAKPEVLVGGLFGTMAVFAFAGMAIGAVGRTAGDVVVCCREAFAADPGIIAGTSLPDYKRVVAIVTRAALREMVLPGCLCVAAPVAVGVAGRVVGELTGRPLLGAEVLAGYLVFGTVSGILMALFLDNVGGAWDNAKKYVELGNYGGKGSEAHKAAVTGDTVGDPLKDTAGPSLHVVIKLLSTTILVLGPLFIGKQDPIVLHH